MIEESTVDSAGRGAQVLGVVEAILARRSIRHGFLREPVDRDLIELVVQCGLAAPSSKNAQPWRFHVVQDRRMIVDLSADVDGAKGAEAYVPHDPVTGSPRPEYSSTVSESAAALLDAPAAIFVENLGVFSSGRRGLAAASPEALAGALEGYGFELVGLGAAIENMWLAANSLGLGAAFMGDVVIAESAIRLRLGMRGDLVGVLVIGYGGGSPQAPMDRPALPETSRVEWH